MRRRWRILLLGGTAGFNLLFWLLLGHHYQLKGYLLDYSNTAVVGSVALVLLSYLSASVRQTRPPLPARSLNWQSLWRARLLLVLLPLGVLSLAALLGCSLLVWWQGWQWLSYVSPTLTVPLLWGLMGLAASLPTYVVSTFYWHWVAAVLNAAALPKPVTGVVTTLLVGSLVVAVAWIGTWGFLLLEGYEPYCSQRFVSPSGQRALVLENRGDFVGGDPTGHAYVEFGWWRQEIPTPLNGYEICDASLRVQWSADERRVDWDLGSFPNDHGHWQW